MHPGAVLRDDVLPALGWSRVKLAKRLGVSYRVISQVLREQKPLTPDLAIRVARLLATTPESWLNMQQKLDIWGLERKNALIYKRIERVAYSLA